MPKSNYLAPVLLFASCALVSTVSLAHGKEERTTGRGAAGAPVVYVETQGLYYDSIALTDLPMKGEFQQLIPGTNGLATQYGPGEVGYLGGRWWIDLNADGEMDEGDKFFLCPLLGPGRETP